MALAGPRLDRPTVIGDEGRPRAASLAIASICILAVVSLVGWSLGEPTLVLGIASIVGFAIAGVGLLQRSSFFALAVAHALIVTFGAITILLVVLAPVLLPGGLAISGCALALFGIGLAWADAGTERRNIRVVSAGGVTFLTIVLAIPVIILTSIVVVWLPAALELIGETGSPVLAVLTMQVGGAVLSGIAAFSVPRLPITDLAPTARRPRVRQTQTAIASGFRRLSLGLGLASVLTILGTAALLLLRLSPEQLLPAGLVWIIHPTVVIPLLWVVGLLFGLSMVSAGIRRVTSETAASSRRTQAGIAVGVGLVLLLPIWTLRLFIEPGTILLFAGAIAIGTPLLVLGGVVAVVGQWSGIVPDRSGAPALAAGGLLVVAIGLGSSAPTVTFATVAAAAIVWGLSWNGLAITSELGHLPDTRRIELIKGVGIVGIGIVAVVLARVMLALLELVSLPGSLLGLALVSLGALLVLFFVRG